MNSAWLIELTIGGSYFWRTEKSQGNCLGHWTTNANKAMKFETHEKAELYAGSIFTRQQFDEIKITQHGFDDPIQQQIDDIEANRVDSQ